jgi:hypothetical protein
MDLYELKDNRFMMKSMEIENHDDVGIGNG